MSLTALFLILLAAFAHSTWNLLAKRAATNEHFIWLSSICETVLLLPVAVWAVSIIKGSPVKRRRLFIFLVSLLLLSTTASAQLERFVGTWQIRKSPTTGKVNLTVNIVQSGDTISGTVTFLNPDGTTTQWPIAHTEFRGATVTKSLAFHTEFKGTRLDFQTLDHESIMQWSLTLTHPRRGFLRGDQGHLLIEEKVKKKR